MEKKKKNPYQAHFINFKRILYDFSRWSGWPLFFWFRVKKVYVNKKQKHHIRGGAIVISNHILYSDPMVLHCGLWDRRLDFVITDDITNTKFKHWVFRQWGCIPVNRQKFSLNHFREIVQRLEGGNLIVTSSLPGKSSRYSWAHTAQPREVEILSPSRLRNSLAGTLSGRMYPSP